MSAQGYAPQNAAEAALVAAWPELAPKLVAAAQRKFGTSPWAHEARERAEEEVQDAFVKCLAAARSGAWDGEKVREFVGTVASRQVLDVLRRQKWAAPKRRAAPAGGETEAEAGERAFEALLIDAGSPEAAAVAGAEAGRLRATLGLAFESLSRPERQAVWLHYFNRLPVEAVAASLALTPGRARGLLRRGVRGMMRSVEHEARQRRAGRPDAAARVAEKLGPADAGGCRPWYGSFTTPAPDGRRRGHRGPPQPTISVGLGGRNNKSARAARRLLWAVAHGPLDPWARVVARCGHWGCMAAAHFEARDGLADRRGGPRPPAAPEPVPGAPAPGAVPAGAELLRWRERLGLSRPEAAALAGCSWQTVKNLELRAAVGTGLHGRRLLAAALAAWEAAHPAPAAQPAWAPDADWGGAGAAFAARRAALRLPAPVRGKGWRVTPCDVGREARLSPTAVRRLERGVACGRRTWEALWGALSRLEARYGTAPDGGQQEGGAA